LLAVNRGVFDHHPKLQVLIVHMGGELASVLGRLEFTWHLNYNGVRNPPAGRPYKNKRPPSDYFKTNILVDCMGFNPTGLRAAVEMCGVDRVVFGSDYGPIPYGIKEHVQIVEDVLPSPAERQQVFWKTSNRFVAGALAVIRYAKIHGTKYRPWIAALLARRPTKVAAIALANKLARIAWAMMASGERYNYPASLRV